MGGKGHPDIPFGINARPSVSSFRLNRDLKSPVVLATTMLQTVYIRPPNTRLANMSFSTTSLSGSANVASVTLGRTATSSGSSMYAGSLTKRRMSGLWIPVSRSVPSPAMLRMVSGRNTAMAMTTMVDNIRRNTKMDLFCSPPFRGVLSELIHKITDIFRGSSVGKHTGSPRNWQEVPREQDQRRY